MQNERILKLNNKNAQGDLVIYLMSRDQRCLDNHALLAAQTKAQEINKALIVMFNLLPNLGIRSQEHFSFMLKGLEQVSNQLGSYNIPFVLTYGNYSNLIDQIKQLDPAAVYLDFTPLNGPRSLAMRLAADLECSVSVVDTHNIIPVWIASPKQEFAAHTMRHKIHNYLARYLVEPNGLASQSTSTLPSISGISFRQAEKKISLLKSSGLTIEFKPGPKEALDQLEHFINNKLAEYALLRNDIASDYQSGLSPYLHFGNISSLRVALNVLEKVKSTPLLFEQAKIPEAQSSPNIKDGMNALFEEMIVRKELADNFCFYNTSYKDIDGLPTWAIDSLNQHQNDSREYTYTLEELENARTADSAWNAAQIQLKQSAKMHGYMRMYWAKKILEWTSDIQTAINYCVYLNDRYSIDGNDPNGYVGILWSIGGLHDRPWPERPIYGKIRYMNRAGLQRKFNLDKYIESWQAKK